MPSTHLSGSDVQLNLTTVSTHQGVELLANTLEGTKTVVLGQGLEEVLEDVALVGTGELVELLDDLLLVGLGESGGTEDGDQLGIGLQGLAEGSHSLGGLLESRGLGGSSVLDSDGGLENDHDSLILCRFFSSRLPASPAMSLSESLPTCCLVEPPPPLVRDIGRPSHRRGRASQRQPRRSERGSAQGTCHGRTELQHTETNFFEEGYVHTRAVA